MCKLYEIVWCGRTRSKPKGLSASEKQECICWLQDVSNWDVIIIFIRYLFIIKIIYTVHGQNYNYLIAMTSLYMLNNIKN